MPFKEGLIGCGIGVILTLALAFYFKPSSLNTVKTEVKTEYVEVQGKERIVNQVVERVITKTAEGETISEKISTNSAESEQSSKLSSNTSKVTSTQSYTPKNLLQVTKGLSLSDRDYILTYGRGVLVDNLYLTGSYAVDKEFKKAWSLGLTITF